LQVASDSERQVCKWIIRVAAEAANFVATAVAADAPAASFVATAVAAGAPAASFVATAVAAGAPVTGDTPR
jgi:hypothetical protein